jgi:NAD(P)-dependent dehydrogenase (short-subunit alcohol dehydrogenase family)
LLLLRTSQAITPLLTIPTRLQMHSIIFITGANRGIGFCIAQVLSRQKPDNAILVTARTQSSASDAVQKLMASGAQTTLEPMVLDVTSDQSMHARVAVIKERYGRLDGKYSIDVSSAVYETNTPLEFSSIIRALQQFLVRISQTIVRSSTQS